MTSRTMRGKILRGKIRRIVFASIAAALLLFLIAAGREALRGQRADYGWKPGIARPRFASTHPRVVLDQAHNNGGTAGIGSRYWPFARLLRADGCKVIRGTSAFTPAILRDCDLLVVANARGAPNPQFFGINLPVRSRAKGGRTESDPAFTETEIRAVREWVEQGGSLLLIADHAPMGAASAGLASAFGVEMRGGYVEVPGESSDPLLFSAENGRLGDHAILAGDLPGTAVTRAMTFTGQSLDAPDSASILLRLPASAVEYVPADSGFRELPAGAAQAVALERGRGRVVVLGEAAALTAQVYKGAPFGMNAPGNDNRQLALNIVHWLLARR